jgi:hypothetical protein
MSLAAFIARISRRPSRGVRFQRTNAVLTFLTLSLSATLFLQALCIEAATDSAFGAGKPISCVAELNGVSLEGVLQKRRLDQALNAKEFAVVAGVSYSTARQWLRLPGFPALHGVVFWSDLVEWRRSTLGIPTQGNAEENQVSQPKNRMLPLRALQILSEAG